MKVKEESEQVGLKHNIQETKIMASSPITSWQTDEETMETVRDFIFLGSKITADGDCSHEIKRCLILGRKAMTNLDNILKSRDITLLTKVCIVKAMIFPIVMYGCESWTLKKAEHLWNCDVGEDSWESYTSKPWIGGRSRKSWTFPFGQWCHYGDSAPTSANHSVFHFKFLNRETDWLRLGEVSILLQSTMARMAGSCGLNLPHHTWVFPETERFCE